MGEKHESLTERWQRFQPTKMLWFWSSVGLVIAVLIVGFSWGGWVTGGTAQEMTEEAAEEARAQLAASVCVERFVNGENFTRRLTELKDVNSWDREDVITEGQWVQFTGVEEPIQGAAELCADRLAAMDVPAEQPEEEAASAEGTTAG